jgi:hypothetical protein
MSKARGVRIGVAIALGAVTLAAGLALALPLSQPSTWTPDQPRLAAVSDARAMAATATTPPDLTRARIETRHTLSQRPLDAAAWARLAWIADQEGREPAMLDALDRSYVAAPHGPEITEWRLGFAFDRWGRLTPELRAQVRAELAVAGATRPGLVGRVRLSVVDPAGRMAMALTPPITLGR